MQSIFCRELSFTYFEFLMSFFNSFPILFLPPIVTILSEVSQYFAIKEKKRATYFSHMTIKENQCQ
jgi:hypothetical protein